MKVGGCRVFLNRCNFVNQTGSKNATSLIFAKATYPVNYEDFADIKPLLQELGCNGDRVEITEAPTK